MRNKYIFHQQSLQYFDAVVLAGRDCINQLQKSHADSIWTPSLPGVIITPDKCIADGSRVCRCSQLELAFGNN